jgi:type VI secretion system protein ImpL
VLFWYGYQQSGLYLTRVTAATEQVKVRLDGYGMQGRALPPFGQTLAILDSLRDLSGVAQDLSSGRVFRVSVVEDQAQSAYRRGLDDLLVPYVMRSLETAIVDRNIPVAIRFQQLKLYLMLGGAHTLDKALLPALAPFFIATLLAPTDTPEARNSLRYHLAALSDPGPPPSTLDTAKVAEARRLIAEVTLAKIAYDLLRDEVAARNVPPWRAGDNMSNAGARVLALASGASVWDGVSALYTRAGYLTTLPPLARQMASKLTADSWVLGASTTTSGSQLQVATRIVSGIYDLYRADYIRVWDSLLSDLTVVPLSTPSQAAEVLAILIGAPSPLKQLLEAIAEQTNFDLPAAAGGLASSVVATNPLLSGLPAPPRDPISAHFAPMRNAVVAPQGKESQIDGVLKVVEALYRQLNHLATGGDILELGTEPQSVLNQSNDLIGRLPPSLQPVFTRIRKEAGAVAEGRSRERLKAIWSSTVLPACIAATRGKYPFDPSAAKDLEIADFGRLFAPDGAIAAFRNMYLKSFLDTTERPWKWRTARNIDLQLGDATLKAFEQADAIASALFEGGKPSMHYTIEFTSLDRRADTIQLDVGGAVASYAHGPVTPTAAQWPQPVASPVTLSATPEVEGRTNAITADGPWGLFRVMQKAKVTIAGPIATAQFMLGNRQTTVRLNSASPRHPFDSRLFTNFSCPTM